MKLDKIKFAQVIAYLGRIGLTIGMDEIADLDSMIDVDVPEPEQIYPNASLVTDLLVAFRDQKKIDAIRAHRAMTGVGLKESKDEVEKYWPYAKPNAWTKKELSIYLNNNPPANQTEFNDILAFIERLD